MIHDEIPDTPVLYDGVVNNENVEPEHEDNSLTPVEVEEVVEEVVDPSQRANDEDDAEAATIAVHDVQDFEGDTVVVENGDDNHADN